MAERDYAGPVRGGDVVGGPKVNRGCCLWEGGAIIFMGPWCFLQDRHHKSLSAAPSGSLAFYAVMFVPSLPTPKSPATAICCDTTKGLFLPNLADSGAMPLNLQYGGLNKLLSFVKLACFEYCVIVTKS